MDRIITPFGFHTDASEILADVDLTGKRVIVTGGASGIGIETARALAGASADRRRRMHNDLGRTVRV